MSLVCSRILKIMAINKFIKMNLPEKIITKKYILETNPTDLRQLNQT